MIGFATLFIITDRAKIGMSAETTGPGSKRNDPLTAVNKLIATCGI
jgi:hypothetical protein